MPSPIIDCGVKIRRVISERTRISAGFKPAVSPAQAARCTESAVRTPARSVAARRESATRANAAVAPPAEGPRGHARGQCPPPRHREPRRNPPPRYAPPPALWKPPPPPPPWKPPPPPP